MLEHARHRFLSDAEAVVNADVDELILTKNSEPLFNIVRRSDTGYLQYPGSWIEGATEAPAAGGYRHFDFYHRAKDPVGGFMWKWAVAPRRCPQEARWLPHRVSRMKADALSGSVSYRHFRAINTGWKYSRDTMCVPSEGEHTKDAELEAAMQVLKLPDQQAWLIDLEARLKAQEARMQAMAGALDTRDREVKFLRSKLARKDAELSEILRSASWRTAGPIRILKRSSAYVQDFLRKRTK